MLYKAVIIDDEPWVRNVIKQLGNWDDLNIDVVGEASDGEYGFALIEELRPDIIITDVKMPYLNGIDLLKRLREKGNHSKVLVVSGYDDFSYIRDAFQLDAKDYLLKPIKPEELNAQLSRCVKELKENQTINAKESVRVDAFSDIEWYEEYDILRNSLRECLYSSQEIIICEKFSEIQQLIQTKQKDPLSKNCIISIYYDLIGQLQLFISSHKYCVSDIFVDKDTTLVFSRDCTFNSMLSHVQSLYLEALRHIGQLNSSANRIDISLIEQYVKDYYLEGITLKQTAANFYVSKEYLSKLFKEHTGKSFSDYVTELRMNKARDLIIEYKVPLKEIGLLVGYSDQAHFYKVFKRHFSITPGEMQSQFGQETEE